MKIEFAINGQPRSVDLPPMTRLLDTLRGPLGLIGTKEGCGEGECGTCLVLLDGEPVNACLVAVGQCDGRSVTTIEGLSRDGRLAPLQQQLNEHGGAQCGMCTPGVLLAAEALLAQNDTPSEQDIRRAIAGNLCRCTGYERIVQGIRAAAARRRDGEDDPVNGQQDQEATP